MGTTTRVEEISIVEAAQEYLSYSYGTTPDYIILERAPDPYPMGLVGEAAQVVEKVVNIGIDSHLEACFDKDIDNYTWERDKNPLKTSRLNCEVSPKSLVVLLRRLYEEGSEEAEMLRRDILDTLDIEEI